MPELTLTVGDVTTFNRAVGDYVAPADWVAGFDHAALVAAYRSRADGKDLRVRHTTAGPVPLVTITGLNSTNCRIGFNLVAGILGSMGDTAYRVGFGDLGANLQSFVAAGAFGPGVCLATAGSVPAPALPDPGYDLTEVMAHGVRAFDTGLQGRTATLHEHDGQVLRAQWRGASGETAYEIRAVLAATKGAGTFTYAGYTYRLVPGSFSMEQTSSVSWNVSLSMENVQL